MCVRACWLRVLECGECGALLGRGCVLRARGCPRGRWQGVRVCVRVCVPGCVHMCARGPGTSCPGGAPAPPRSARAEGSEGVTGAPRPLTPTCRAVCCFASSARRWQAADRRRRPGCGAPGGWRWSPARGADFRGRGGGPGRRALMGVPGRGGTGPGRDCNVRAQAGPGSRTPGLPGHSLG